MITDDEFSVLMIAAGGSYMLAIGRWANSIKSLERKGFLRVHTINGGPQYTITDTGREAIAGREQSENQQFAALGSELTSVQKACRNHVEVAAQAIASCARESSRMTGDLPAVDAERWLKVILNRVKDLLNG
jgi:hypothetical protein